MRITPSNSGQYFDKEKITVSYNASNISVLEGLEPVRKRPGMYVGSTSVKGLNHLIYEILDNSVDEHLAGYCTLRPLVTLQLTA